MTQPALPLLISPPTRRRGRPPGAKSKRSIDLARYVEATMGGMTPGQQSAELAMVKPKDLVQAKAQAAALQIPDLGLSPLMLAMVVKAQFLAQALGCDARDAWLLLQKERSELMPYIHQRRAPEAESKGKAPATVFVITEGEAAQGQLADFSADGDEVEFVGELGAAAEQVGQPKSDGDT